MSDSRDHQIQQLQATIAQLEAQRALLGDAVVETSLAVLRPQLAALQAEPLPAPVQERRLVSILFADVVGSTALAESMDPEEWHEIIKRLHTQIGEIIRRHQGGISQYLGDGALALFGAQQPSEFDAENAIRAALEIQADVSTQAGRPQEPDTGSLQPALGDLHAARALRLRVGVHTGLVVTGEGGMDTRKELMASGDAMNLAERLQEAAPPGGVLISHDTYTHVRGVFTITPQSPMTVAGRSETLQTYLVHGAKPRPFRTVTRGVAGVQTRTVGRAAELQTLRAAYLDAWQNRRTVWAQVIGEPGVGKSRVLDDLRDWIDLRVENVRLLRARALPGDPREPYALIRRMWFDRFQIAEDEPIAGAEAKWVAQFRALWGASDAPPGEIEERAHALGLFVGLPFQSSPYIGAMRTDPVQLKGRALVVSRELLAVLRRASPIVILLEDLHWGDSASWEYLQTVILEADGEEEGQGMYVLATARPDWAVPDTLSGHPAFRKIELSPLSDESCRELVHALLARVEGFPDAMERMVVGRAEGVPYFAEELVNLLIDRGVVDVHGEPWRYVPGVLDTDQLPQTLQQLLLTRLLALSPAQRACLQRGSVYGRQFWEGGLAAMGLFGSNALLQSLHPRGLVAPVTESSFKDEREWTFHHTLLQQVTYESVLKRDRPALHRAAAGWLEEQARQARRLDEFAGLIGEHCDRAGEPARAAEWYLRAGARAQASSALEQAQRYFDRALELLPADQYRLQWRGVLGREAVLHLKGERETQKADIALLLELAERLDDDALRAEAFWRQAECASAMGDYRMALTAADTAITAATRAGALSLEVRARAERVAALARLGDPAAAQAAQETLARALESGDIAAQAYAHFRVGFYCFEVGDRVGSVFFDRESAALAHQAGDRSLEASALGNVSAAYGWMGLFEQACASTEQARDLCAAIGDRRTQAYHLLNLGMVYLWMGDASAARLLEEQVQQRLTAIRDAPGLAFNQLYMGYILEAGGENAEAQFAGARRGFMEIGMNGPAIEAQAGEARCALAAGRPDEARRVCDEVWAYLSQYGGGALESPLRVYQSAIDIYAALGDDRTSRVVLAAAYQELMERAGKITDPDWRRSYLQNFQEHRAVIEMYNRSEKPW
ncbi:MAG: adenylate/guanylate cyclase domain-containing protein [Anaerolineae bacterium]